MTGKPSIDKPWLKFYPEDADKVPLPEMTAYQYLYERNKDYMDGIALEYFGVKVSYATFFKMISASAKAFTALEVTRGSIVTIMMPNTPEAVYSFYALNKLGACANMLSPAFTPEHIADSVSLTNSKIVVIMDKFYTALKPVFAVTGIEKIIVVSGGETLGQVTELMEQGNVMSWQDFVVFGERQVEILAEYKPETPAIIVYSSGSTGASKGIVLTNDSFTVYTQQYDVESCILRNCKRSLSIIPCFFSTGISTSLNLYLCNGITVVLEPSFGEKTFIKQIIESEPNCIIAPTSLWTTMLTNEELKHIDLSFFKVVVAGGEPLPDSLKKIIDAFLSEHNSTAKLGNGWGMCEYGAGATMGTTILKGYETQGVGIPLPQMLISVFDTDTNEELGYNERGEIRVITPSRMLGYYKNPKATAEFFREGKDGQIWGCSGDMGYIDEDGNVFIEGRVNDYIYGKDGNKIWLFDIENTLMADEAVQLCEAVGLTVGSGDVPVVHLVLKQGCTDSLEDVIQRLRESCMNALSHDAVPYGYKIRDGFHVLPSGKRDTLSLKNERDGFLAIDGNILKTANFPK